MDNDMLMPGAHGKGRRVITFDNILQNDTIPLAAVLRNCSGYAATKCAVM